MFFFNCTSYIQRFVDFKYLWSLKHFQTFQMFTCRPRDKFISFLSWQDIHTKAWYYEILKTNCTGKNKKTLFLCGACDVKVLSEILFASEAQIFSNSRHILLNLHSSVFMKKASIPWYLGTIIYILRQKRTSNINKILRNLNRSCFFIVKWRFKNMTILYFLFLTDPSIKIRLQLTIIYRNDFVKFW